METKNYQIKRIVLTANSLRVDEENASKLNLQNVIEVKLPCENLDRILEIKVHDSIHDRMKNTSFCEIVFLTNSLKKNTSELKFFFVKDDFDVFVEAKLKYKYVGMLYDRSVWFDEDSVSHALA